MKRKNAMPSYYGKNIAQNAQRRFFQRKKLELEAQKSGNVESTEKAGKMLRH